MGKALKIILKILLVLLVLCLLAGGIYLLVRHFNWPLWWGGTLLALIIGLVVGIFFIRRVLRRHRAKQFVKTVVETEAPEAHAREVEKRIILDELKATWEKAINTLKDSRLRKQGDPVYVLPWYMVIGEPGSGKTAALRNSGLTTSFPEFSVDSGTTGTRTFNFWFFKKAIVLDTAGKYAVSVHEGKEKEEEWQEFLTLLCTYRKKEPINGLIVTVPADKLMQNDKGVLEEYGRCISARINQTMRVMGANFPIYILVTKADLILGMASFSSLLPRRAIKQAMGHVNQENHNSIRQFVSEAIKTITDRLKDLRLLILYHNEKITDPGLLLFPDEFARIEHGLQTFTRVVFQENPYQEPPYLRGIFFCSGMQAEESQVGAQSRQGVTPLQTTGHQVGAQLAAPRLATVAKGLFLRDFFYKTLPPDRKLYSPTREYLSWRRHTRGMGITAWLAVTLSICALLTISFVKNLNAVVTFKTHYQTIPQLSQTGRMLDDIFALGDFLKEIQGLEETNRKWLFPRMGLHQSVELERHTKDIFLKKYRSVLFVPTNKALFDKITTFNTDTPDAVIGDYAEHFARRVNLHSYAIAHKGSEKLAEKLMEMPAPFSEFLPFVDPDLVATAGPFVNRLYVYWVAWQDDPQWLSLRREELQVMLKRLLTVKGDNPTWMVAWANNKKDLSPVTIDQFWAMGFSHPTATEDAQGASVHAAFTLDGKARIDDLLGQISDAMQSQMDIKALKNDFYLWYNNEYIAAWYKFANYFNTATLTLGNITDPNFNSSGESFLTEARAWKKSDWQSLAIGMTSISNPFFQLLDKMATELEHLKSDPASPKWLVLLVNFQKMESQATTTSQFQQTLSIAGKPEAGGGIIQATQATEEQIIVKNPSFPLQTHLKAIKEFQSYQKALSDFAPIVSSTDHSYNMVVQLFKNISDPQSSSTPFDDGNASILRMKLLIGNNKDDEKIFWDIYQGPIVFLLYYSYVMTSCTLQTEWEADVLSQIQAIPANRLQKDLFDQQTGIVWKFLNTKAQPFVARNEKGYYPASFYEAQIPFYPVFFNFLNSGASSSISIEPEYNVIIKTLPFDINDDATERPSGVLVRLDCTDGAQRIENYNFPLVKTFKWTPGACGDVTLDIIVGEVTLTKKYQGYTGFPNFLADFMDGTHTFGPADFPDNVADMTKMNLKEITVKYELKGHAPVIKLGQQTPLDIPRRISWCGD